MLTEPDRGSRRNLAIWVLGSLMLASAILQLHYRSGLDFQSDEWTFMFDRSGGGLSDFVAPHAEHCVVVLSAIYRVTFSLFGFDSPMPMHVFSVSVYLVSVAMLFQYLSRLVGEWAALIGCAVVLFLGAAYPDLIWSFQVGFSLPIAAGLATLLLLKRDDRWSEFGASILLVLAILTTSMGIPFLVGAVVEILVRRREVIRRLLAVAALPVLVYVAWWLGWGHSAETHISLSSVLHTPEYVLNSIQYSVGVLTGTFRIEGTVGVVIRSALAGLALVLAARHVRRRGSVPPALVVGLAVGLTFWVFSGIGQSDEWLGREFDTPRYQYPNAVFMLMILAGVFAGAVPTRRTLGGVGLIAVVAIVVNLGALSDGYPKFKTVSDGQYVDYTAMEIARDSVNPDFEFAPDEYHFYATPAAAYFDATDRYGSLGWSPDEVDEASEPDRQDLDRLLVSALPVSFLETKKPVESDCQVVSPNPASGDGEIEVPAGSTTVSSKSDAVISLRRFADESPVEGWQVPAGSTWLLEIPADASPRSWTLSATEGHAVTACMPD